MCLNVAGLCLVRALNKFKPPSQLKKWNDVRKQKEPFCLHGDSFKLIPGPRPERDDFLSSQTFLGVLASEQSMPHFE